ncbi:hypothetical protein HNP86_001974 [Methanococcus maripaludis]|uniref:Uncharacterized protein n=1 Tax=Methanococcus maripaludis TaxID=39152 RepID=A0A7J9NX40_METMI|nr:hypothetical protein [Methanococcus maripaludis]MBA2851815.1 hypothetical protein [Methanococcus maripaludis]
MIRISEIEKHATPVSADKAREVWNAIHDSGVPIEISNELKTKLVAAMLDKGFKPCGKNEYYIDATETLNKEFYDMVCKKYKHQDVDISAVYSMVAFTNDTFVSNDITITEVGRNGDHTFPMLTNKCGMSIVYDFVKVDVFAEKFGDKYGN